MTKIFKTVLKWVSAAALLIVMEFSTARADCTQKFYQGTCPSVVAAATALAGPAPQSLDDKAEDAPSTEVVLRIGNESNQNDGIRGPFTYGFHIAHVFKNGSSLEGGMVRLHERGAPLRASFLDEAQLTWKSREGRIFNQPMSVAGTVWKNRMMDMYTNVAGLETTRTGRISLNGGLYGGTATLGEAGGRFFGIQGGASGSLGPIELAIEHMNGVIRTSGDGTRLGEGRYRKSGLEAATNLHIRKLPIAVTLAVEKRYFNFGNGGPVSDPRDSVIVVSGVEANVSQLLRAAHGAFSGSAH